MKRQNRGGVMGISEEGCMMLPVASVSALIHLSVRLYLDVDKHTQCNTFTCMHSCTHSGKFAKKVVTEKVELQHQTCTHKDENKPNSM